MNRSYLILLFAAALFLVMIGFGLYGRLTAPPPAPATTQPATQPLVDRLREERERRLRERGERRELAEPATAPSTGPVVD